MLSFRRWKKVRLIIKDYLLQLKEKDELDLLLCDLLLQMGYVTDNRPETGNRQYGVDIRAHNEDSVLICTVKQGDLNRKNWDSDPNSVRQSLNEIHDCYLGFLTDQDREKNLRIIVATNGMMDEAVSPNWDGYVKQNTLWQGITVKIEFWNIDIITDFVQKYLFDEHIFGPETQSLLRRALYYIGDGDYPAKYYEQIVNGFLQNLDPNDSAKERKKKLSAVFLATQMIAQYAAESRTYKISIMVSEYLIIRYWHYLLTHHLFEKASYIDWLLKFLGVYEKWNNLYYNAVKFVCEGTGRIPDYNSVEQRVTIYNILGHLSCYAYYLSFKTDTVSQKLCNEIQQHIVLLINNYPQSYYPPYDVNINVVSMVLRLMDRLGKRRELGVLIHNYSHRLRLYFQLHGKYPSPQDSFEDAVDIYMGTSAEEYETSAFWGIMLEWISLTENSEVYTELQPFLADSLKDVTKCTWFLRADEEQYLYDYYAMNSAGDGVAFEQYKNYEEFKSNTDFIMNQYSNEQFSFDEHGFSALELILARYFCHLIRVKAEQ